MTIPCSAKEHTLLEQSGGIEVVGATGQGAVALRLVEDIRPDILLLDVHLPDLNGIEVAREVGARYKETAVVVLTGHESKGYIRAFVQLGARGYLNKTASSREIVETIRRVAEGQTVLPSDDRRLINDGLVMALTARELQVLRLLQLDAAT